MADKMTMTNKSKKILESCHEDLQTLLTAVDKIIPIVIVEGYRNPIRQEYLYVIGATKVKKGKHNLKPSVAVDAYPEPVNWTDIKRMYFFGGIVRATADHLGISIRWGGDWDGDTEVLDQTFNDLGHIEIL